MGSEQTGIQRTGLAGRNLIECTNCESVIDGDHHLKRTVRWGFWDAEAQNYKDAPRSEHYCRSCWSEEFQRDAAAYFEVTDPEKLWNILAAANGDLVADLQPMLIGGRVWVQVVDGELRSMHVTREMDERPDPPILKHTVEEIEEADRDWFDELFEDVVNDEDEGQSGEEDMPIIVMLKPEDETPFEEYEELPDDQTTLDSPVTHD